MQKKFNETAQTANFTDFPLILCGNGPKGTKTMQTQTLFSQIGNFFQGFQKMWLFLLLKIFKPEFENKKTVERPCPKKNQRLPNRHVLRLIQRQNLKRIIVAVALFLDNSYFR